MQNIDNPQLVNLSECTLDSVSVSVCVAARVDVAASGQGQLSDNSPIFTPSCRWSTCSGFLHQLLDLDWHVGSDYIHGELCSSTPDLHSNYDQTLIAVALIGFAPELWSLVWWNIFWKRTVGEIKKVKNVFGSIFSSCSIRIAVVAQGFFCRQLMERALESSFGNLHDHPFILCPLLLGILTIDWSLRLW